MSISVQPRFQGKITVHTKQEPLTSYIITEMIRYTPHVSLNAGQIELRFKTEKSDTTSGLRAFVNRIKERLAMSRLREWRGKYNIRVVHDTQTQG